MNSEQRVLSAFNLHHSIGNSTNTILQWLLKKFESTQKKCNWRDIEQKKKNKWLAWENSWKEKKLWQNDNDEIDKNGDSAPHIGEKNRTQ